MNSFTEKKINNVITPHLLGLVSLLSEHKGNRGFYEKQPPEVLDSLLEECRLESVEASNKMDGLIVDEDRIKALVNRNLRPKGRLEGEIAGYRDVINRIISIQKSTPITIDLILKYHMMLYKHTDVKAGVFSKTNNVVNSLNEDSDRLQLQVSHIFPNYEFLEKLVARYQYCTNNRKYPQILLIPLFIFDYLCIRPFPNGNGRVARLLTQLLLYQAGFKVIKYISLDKIIEQNRELYYGSFENSSKGWHDGEHDLEPWLRFFYNNLISAYKEFSIRVKKHKKATGGKRSHIIKFVNNYPGDFGIADIDSLCPQVSRETIRKVMQELKKQGVIDVSGKGRYARWKKTNSI